jgi:hypothetical protein
MKATYKYILKEKNMSSWEDYKETFNLSEDIFALARSGNVERIQEFLKNVTQTMEGELRKSSVKT